MAGKSRFDISVTAATTPQRERRAGPMGSAGREVGESLSAATEAQVEARRRNAADARAFREAREDGRVLSRVPLGDIRTDDLPRDRMLLEEVATSDEMDELKASIRARGQREPIEVYRDADGRLQLKKGWRRLTALRALHAETGDPCFAEAVCRVDEGAAARVDLFIDMVEENAIREDLSFAEMAQLAVEATRDPACGFATHDDAIRRLYGSLHKMKRSNIRQFAVLIEVVGDHLRWPKAIGRDLGANVGRKLRTDREQAQSLRASLAAAQSAQEQNAVLQAFLGLSEVVVPMPAKTGASKETGKPTGQGAKYQFRHGAARVTARSGECRIVAPDDFAAIPRERLAAAVAAFYAKLSQ